MNEEYEQKIFSDLTGGINVSVPAEKIADNQSPYIKNMIIEEGLLKKDWGYYLEDEPISGQPKLIYEFHRKDRTTEILLFTTTRMFLWKMGTWEYVGCDETTVDGEHVFGYTPPMAVADGSIFSQYDFVGITLEDGTQFTAVLTFVSGNNITLGTALGVSDVVLDGARIIKIASFAGTEDYPIVATTFPASDSVIVTNGKDDIQIYDGSLIVPVPNLVTAVGGGNCSAKTVLVKDNKVILFNTNENGTDYPQRVRWSATGDPEDWTTADDAGYEDLYGDPYHITAAAILGPSIIVYKEKSIIDMKYVGTSDFVYYFTTMLQEVGAASPYAVIDFGDHHKVLDIERGFYIYQGGYQIQPFGQQVFKELFSSTGNISRTYRQQIFTTYIESRHLYVAMLPINQATYPNIAYMYHTDYDAWTKREFTANMTGMQEILLVSGITWAEAEGAWEDSEWFLPWNDITISTAEYQVMLWGYEGAWTRTIWKYANSYTADDEEDFTGWYQTPELVNPQGNVRVDRVKVKGSGTAISVEYTIDGGENWLDYGTLAPGSEIIATSVWKQVVGTRIMFRLSGTDMLLSWAAVYWSKEDEE